MKNMGLIFFALLAIIAVGLLLLLIKAIAYRFKW